MNGHPQFSEDFDLYLLGTLEGEEREALESHIQQCPECRRQLAGAQARVAMLALAAPTAVPAPQVRERLMRRIHAEAGSRGQLSGQPPSEAWAFLRWATPALAVAALVLAAAAGVLMVQNHRLSERLANLESARRQLEEARRQDQAETSRARAVLDLLTASDTERVTLVAGTARPVPQGKAFYNAKKGLLFYAANLPALAPGKTYELWLVPATGPPIEAGVFNPDPKGNGEVVLPSLPSGVTARAFAVTIEPAGGLPAPTGPKVLIGIVS